MLARVTSHDPLAALDRIVIGAIGLTTHALAEAAPATELTFRSGARC